MPDVALRIIGSWHQRNDLTGVDAPCSCAIGAGKRAEVVIEGVIFLEDENDVLNLRRACRHLGIGGGS